MKFIAAFFALAALAIATPTAANAQLGPSTNGATPVEANGIIAILIGFTPPIGSNKGSYTAPIGSNKGSLVSP